MAMASAPLRSPCTARGIATALLMGTLLTVGVSWLAMFLPTGHAWHGPPTTQALGAAKAADGKFWQLTRGRNAWHTTVSYWHMQISGMSMWMSNDDYQGIKVSLETLAPRFRPEALTDLHMHAWYHTTGWPFPAMACSVHWKQQISNADILYTVRGGVQLPRDASFNPRALPLTPVWPGFVGNVVCYGVAWVLVSMVVLRLRDSHRARRHLCRACRYPTDALPAGAPCPECGTPLRARRPLR